MKRVTNILLVAGMLLIGMSMQLACKSTKQITKPETNQPIAKPQKVFTKPPVNPFKSDTTKPPNVVKHKIVALNTVHFAFDKSNIDTPDAQLLADNVKVLRKHPDMHVRIDAYTDHIGGDQYNLRLSERRAQTVQSFYTSNGIDTGRIVARGLGKAPVACIKMDTNGPGCRKNRRAESHPFYPPGA